MSEALSSVTGVQIFTLAMCCAHERGRVNASRGLVSIIKTIRAFFFFEDEVAVMGANMRPDLRYVCGSQQCFEKVALLSRSFSCGFL